VVRHSGPHHCPYLGGQAVGSAAGHSSVFGTWCVSATARRAHSNSRPRPDAGGHGDRRARALAVSEPLTPAPRPGSGSRRRESRSTGPALPAATANSSGSFATRKVSRISPSSVILTITDRLRCRSIPTYCRWCSTGVGEDGTATNALALHGGRVRPTGPSHAEAAQRSFMTLKPRGAELDDPALHRLAQPIR